MKSKNLTNTLKCSYDSKNFDAYFTIICISNKKREDKATAFMIDELVKNKDIYLSAYQRGHDYYFLLKEDKLSHFKNYLDNLVDRFQAKHAAFSVISSDKIKPFVLENLFLNCLAQEIYSDIFQYYEIVIPWATENDEISTSRSRLAFQTVSINESENLLIRAQQFRKIESLRKKKKEEECASNEENKNKIKSVAELSPNTLFYDLENTYEANRFKDYRFSCFRKGDVDIGKCQEMYVKGAFYSGHNIKPMAFADFSYTKNGERLRSDSYHNNSRNHLYFEILKKMNAYGEGVITFSFIEYSELEKTNQEIKLKSVEKYKKDTLNILENYFSTLKIRITTKEKELLPKCKIVSDLLSYYNFTKTDKFPLIAWIDSEVMFNKMNYGGPNIVITHPEDFYKDNNMVENDTYRLTVDDELIVQHMTDEVFISEAKLKAALSKSVFALAVKSDIVNKKMTLFDKSYFENISKSVSIVDFITASRESIDEEQDSNYGFTYYCMQINLNTMELEFHKYASENELPEYIRGLILQTKSDENYDNFIIENKERIFAIKRTETIALIDEKPMLEHIYKVENGALADGESESLRAKSNQHLIENALNIHCYLCENEIVPSIQICSGIILNGGMNRKIPKAIHMYNVCCYNSKGLDEEHLKAACKYLDLMKLNCITSSERFTVLPFPFHYVREYKNYLNALKKKPKEDSNKCEPR